MTVHLLGLAHSELTGEFEHCAYSARTRDFATLLHRAGQRVILYAPGDSTDAECDEFVSVVSSLQRKALWPNYEPKRDVFNDFSPDLPGWQAFNAIVAAAIRARAEQGDTLALTMGYSQRPVASALGVDVDPATHWLFPVEVGIGYSGTWAPYRVYESKAWRDFMAEKEPRDDVRVWDDVIPRAWLAEQFPAGAGDGGYLLFVGRLMSRKGPQIAAEAAKRLGIPLKIAGQGALSWSRTLVVCSDGTRLEGDVEYLGVLDAKTRAEVMGGATAILTPTHYFEPLGGVSIEAQLTGTPAIVSDWGGLPANVIEGKTGFACNILRDYTKAVERATSLDRKAIRRHALASWSTKALAPRWLAYLDRLSVLRGDGWYSE